MRRSRFEGGGRNVCYKNKCIHCSPYYPGIPCNYWHRDLARRLATIGVNSQKNLYAHLRNQIDDCNEYCRVTPPSMRAIAADTSLQNLS